MLFCVQTSLSCFSQPVLGVMIPPSPWIGSTNIAHALSVISDSKEFIDFSQIFEHSQSVEQ